MAAFLCNKDLETNFHTVAVYLDSCIVVYLEACLKVTVNADFLYTKCRNSYGSHENDCKHTLKHGLRNISSLTIISTLGYSL